MSSIASSGIRLRRPAKTKPREEFLDWDEVRATLRVVLLPTLVLLAIVWFGVEPPQAPVEEQAPAATNIVEPGQEEEEPGPEPDQVDAGPLSGLAAAAMVLFVAARSLRSPEPLLALSLAYVPLARTYPAVMLPGVNGTNLLILLMLFFWWYHAKQRRDPMWRPLPGNGLVLMLLSLSVLSAVTAMVKISPAYLFTTVPLEFKAWLEQFFFFFAFANLIRDGAMARRMVVYMILGTTLALALGVMEMVARSDMELYEYRRVFGPHVQPNDYGAFLVYASLVLVAWLAVKPFSWRRWLTLPWLGVVAKVLVATGSRGAWLAMAAGLSVITWLRGLRYVVLAVVGVTVLLTAFPELIPYGIRERIEQTRMEATASDQADASTTHRLMLWQAGLEMTLESPLLGKGFKGFAHFKQDYVSADVRESDPHNMFLYLSSQMGIPALLAFLAWITWFFVVGYILWRKGRDELTRALGLAGAAVAAAIIGVNFFGSRMVNASTTLYLWVFFAVLAHLFLEQQLVRRKPRQAHAMRNNPGGDEQEYGLVPAGPRAQPPAVLRRERVQRNDQRRRQAMQKRAQASAGIRVAKKRPHK